MSFLSELTGPHDLRAMSIAELEALASEIREAIIAQVQKTGGHLAPNLGVVELTIALHRVFDFSHDRLLFDVGHQCYPHKLVTGRHHLLGRLRTRDGMAGFPEPIESGFDLFRVGHAGTGISTAVGMARGDLINGEAYSPKTNPAGRSVVTLIGDASIVNGVAMEGLNNAGTLRRQFLVVLNDNGMSISSPQGAIAGYFDRVRVSHTYAGFKKGAHKFLRHIPGGAALEHAYHRAGEATKALISEDPWFEKFGLVSAGPIDGHDLPTLIEFLTEVRDIERPVLLHVKTVKGRGLDVAETDATRFHSPRPFVLTRADASACRVEMHSAGRSFTTAFGEAMLGLMERDQRVVACTAAMPDGTGISLPLERFPERTWDVGICESHAMDMMAGLARSGLKPFFAVYSTFLQRAFDQAFQEVALQGLAVRLCLDRAGLVGGDGAVHHGFCDVALLRTLPGGAVLAAIDEPSLKAALDFMLAFDEGFSAVRYPRDSVSERLLGQACPPFELGGSRCLTPALDVLNGGEIDAIVVAYGTPAIAALEAADLLDGEYRVAVYDARFAKPIDDRLVRAALESRRPVITVEDHAVIGGFGSAVLERANELRLDASTLTRLGIPDHWILQDSRSKQLAEVGIDAAGIARAVREAVGNTETPEPAARAVEALPRAHSPRTA